MTRMNTLKYTGLTLAAGALSLSAHMASADIQHLDDVIIGFSLCVGNDCVNGESFGFDTIRLKENNLRIHFQDTSVSASFPTNDWRIVANDTSNGGTNHLSIEDSTAGRSPFRVEAGAPANALVVEADGDIGVKQLNPVVDIHVTEGNTPTLRLEQDGSDGFTPQTYDIASNEANFFIRDVTNGSKLFFRSKPGAPEDSMFIAADGDIGLGTDSPDDALDVENASGGVAIRLTNASGAWRFNQNGAGRLNIIRSTTSNDVLQLDPAANDNLLQLGTVAADQVDITGNLDVSGTISVGGVQQLPDYVFAPDYELMPLYEVEKFIIANQHLPRIPSAAEVEANGLNMTEMQLSLLEKVEELTLYTVQQQKVIDAMQVQLDALAD